MFKVKKGVALLIAYALTISCVPMIHGNAAEISPINSSIEKNLNQDVVSSTNSDISTSSFVTCDGNKFKVDGHDFYFVGQNNYYLPYAPDYMVDDVFADAQAMGSKVMRTWGFIDGASSCDVVLQPSLGVYSEEGFKHFDYAVKKAKESGIKLVIPFVNNWKDFGGMDKYVEWTGAGNHDAFYTNEACKTAYKNYIYHFLNRTNTYTGVKYKDDPTIMTWELGNEPRCKSDATGETLYNWAKEMSEYIKSIDSKHLVALGDEGFFKRDGAKYNWDWNYTGGEGVDWDKLISIPTLDYGTFHLYPDGWNESVDWGTKYIKDHIDAANLVNKPAVLEEYGIKNNQLNVYTTWGNAVINNGGAGLMPWMLSGIGFDNRTLYPDYDGFRIIYPSDIATLLSDNAKVMNAKSIATTGPSVMLGDVNEDNAVDVLDYTALQKYLLVGTGDINKANADVNKDARINTADLFALRKIILEG
ncbi:mannan endo-1,4-beta-mannosidase [Clostridium saccharoperbutylacetonicum]|uniref:mannan endo-1,4-beta-mannosidase n=1 Tax=Clostridium saccharoperbutylacetonicum N1-4(HMT) TaxID=931276 RepID=M1MH21_9CLOT|nr:cellulase family glycosylhydrolase [Clostridium saccharoperbutylacetonicum]AGF55633.1 endo-beta-mannanase [Clostridium saccharoperbutylacetonicum N1-4(HMT)]NRT63644.1 mannan endo-1,4-beta-mannosidase [Clostridium saccharoperbutylacetonicum]NSB27007.1 mannan endo-1,4-beta-mannosidase [Clostridium saccharoperbutylacetonicum]NSB40491.1 mannan endo-1,4-beta-mannosidase [Clostridium saccharoperbutylacetonicum]